MIILCNVVDWCFISYDVCGLKVEEESLTSDCACLTPLNTSQEMVLDKDIDVSVVLTGWL